MPAAWSPPSAIDEYELVRPLGSGGMGEVYLARDTLLEREVAVKFTSEGAVANERFLGEARAAARIHHPNVATVYRIGAVDGRPYLVSEYVRGESLAELAKPIASERALEYAVDLARGLEAAHRKGVLHRDITPANAMLTDEGGVKLIDFGLARLLDDDAPESLAGTPRYIAPELWTGEPPTFASDIWALGAVVYELCSGRHPHAGIDLDELRSAARDPLPLAELVPGIDERFAAAIDRCLVADPERRFSSAGELYEALAAGDHASPASDPRAREIEDELEESGRVLVTATDPREASVLCARHVVPQLHAGVVVPVQLERRPREQLLAALSAALPDPTATTLLEVEPFAGDDLEAAARTALDRLEPDQPLFLFLDRIDSESALEIRESIAILAADPRTRILATAASGAELADLPVSLESLSIDRDPPRPDRRRPPIAIAAAVGAVVAAAAVIWLGSRPGEPLSIQIAAPEAPGPVAPLLAPGSSRRLTLEDGCEEFPSWTPDGQAVVYDANYDGGFAIFASPINGGERRRLTGGTVWNFAPAVSPDGAQIAFVRRDEEGELSSHVMGIDGSGERQITAGRMRPHWADGGEALWIGDARKPTRFDTATWKPTRTLEMPEGTMLFHLRELDDGRLIGLPYPEGATSIGVGLIAWPAAGSTPRWLWRESIEEVLAIDPGGRWIYAAKKALAGPGELWRVPIDGGEPALVPAAGAAPTLGLAFSPDGQRVAWSDCTFEQKLANLVTTGRGTEAVPIVVGKWNDWEPAAIGGTDQLVVISERGGAIELWVTDRRQRAPARRIPTPDLTPASVAVSPDGETIALAAEGKGIYLVPVDGSAKPRLLVDGAVHYYPSFSADGRRVVFESEAGGKQRVASVAVDGGEAKPLFDKDAGEPAVAPGGERIAYLLKAGADGAVPMIWNRETDRHTRLAPDLFEPGWYHHLRFSPDGKRLVILQGGRVLRDVDLATGELVRIYRSGDRQLTGATWVGDGDLLIGLSGWTGGIWTAELATRSAR